jgi:hypothetical protein
MNTLLLRRRIPTVALVLGGILALGVYYALLTHLVFAAQARRLLAVHFAAIPDQPTQALAIWLHNSRLVFAVAAWASTVAAQNHLSEKRIPLWVGDVLLGAWALATVIVAGVLLGAYGAVQAHAFWPFAPVELAAWALLLALYIDTRRHRMSIRRALVGFVSVELLLALAAVLEVGGLA